MTCVTILMSLKSTPGVESHWLHGGSTQTSPPPFLSLLLWSGLRVPLCLPVPFVTFLQDSPLSCFDLLKNIGAWKKKHWLTDLLTSLSCFHVNPDFMCTLKKKKKKKPNNGTVLFLIFWPCHVAHEILVSWLGIRALPLQWKHWFLTTGPPGNSLVCILIAPRTPTQLS